MVSAFKWQLTFEKVNPLPVLYLLHLFNSRGSANTIPIQFIRGIKISSGTNSTLEPHSAR